GDMIYDVRLGIGSPQVIVDPADPMRRKEIPAGTAGEDLLVKVFERGGRVYDPPPLEQIRARTAEQLAGLHPTVRRLLNPHEYPAGLESGLHELKARMIVEARGGQGE